jgi:glycerol-3-phosphate dehydrogenase (NAD(P)+)
MVGLKKRKPVGVIGAGSWGTVLARLLAENGCPVHLWCYEAEVARQITERRENPAFLPGVRLPETIEPVTALAEVIRQKELLLLVVPSHVFRDVLQRMIPFLSAVKPGCLWISATKGVENESLLTMTGIMKEILGEDYHPVIGCLSGPSFAREVARELPTAISLGAPKEAAERAQRLLANGYFRVYTNPDTLGLELGGALKNVIALAAGISDGLGLGHNTRSALITRGLAEISRLGVKLGARQSTFFGLAGIGDLVLTCTGDLSRNRTVGLRLGQGEKLNSILASMNMVAEGVKTARAAYQLALREQVEMPIVAQVYGILYENQAPRRAVRDLMTRDLKSETGDYYKTGIDFA